MVTEHHAVAVASATVPHGVICLLSALQFHGIGTQLPSEVWMALDRRAWKPALRYPPMRIVRFTGPALTEGVERRTIEGRTVSVYGVAKTIADCFKYRNKIGLDVALEALREAWRMRRFTMDDLDRFAAICRSAAGDAPVPPRRSRHDRRARWPRSLGAGAARAPREDDRS
ncbi:MAG: hypothetical protein IPK33_11150 [Gemmatimonadetes bacterium]|nr:hypothetical protein [Gemmatimonadota bacterium]